MTLPWSAKARPAISRTIARTIYYLSVSSAVKAIGDVYKESTTSPGTEDKADELARIAQAIHSLALVLSNEDLPHDFSCSRESGWDRWVLDLNLAQAVESPHKKTTLQRHDRYTANSRVQCLLSLAFFFFSPNQGLLYVSTLIGVCFFLSSSFQFQNFISFPASTLI